MALLQKRAAEIPDSEVYTFLNDGLNGKRQRVSFADLDRRARSIAATLQAQGAEGERVMLFFPPGYDYVAAFFGCIYAGATAVPAYPPDPQRMEHSMERLGPVVRDSGAKFALTNTTIKLLAAVRFRRIPELASLRWITVNGPSFKRARHWREPELTRDSVAFLQYTSGSTGDPKGVMVGHGNLLHNLGWIEARMDLGPDDRGMIWLPPYHDLGLIGGLLCPVYTTFPCTLMSPVDFMRDPLSWLRGVTEFGATVTGGPGFAYDLVARKIRDEQKAGLDLGSLRAAFIGAEPIHPETMEKFSRTFADCGFRRESFFPTFGLAEGTLIVTGGPRGTEPKRITVDGPMLERNIVEPAAGGDASARTIVGCGEIVPDERLEVVNPDTREPARPGSVGEIWISGPSVAQGYWNRPQKTKETFDARLTDGSGPWLRTGDLGFLRDGELFLTGRLKDLIIINGKNYYPQDIEWSAQGAHAALRPGGCVAFAVSRAGGEQLVIVSEMRRGGEHAASEIREVEDAIRRSVLVSLGLRAHDIALIEPRTLPKTSSGKLQRRRTRERWLEGSLKRVGALEKGPRTGHGDAGSTPDSHTPQARALLLISRESAFPVGDIQPAQKLVDDLGFDSLMMAHLFVDLEAEFPDVKLREFHAATTVNDVLEDVKSTRTVKGPSGSLGSRPGGATAAAPPEFRVEDFPEVRQLEKRFELFKHARTDNPYFKVHESPSRDTVKMGDRDMIHFSGYNYVGMSGDPRVSEAAKKAVDQYGTSASASRLASGEIPLHGELERGIAGFIGTEDAIVLVAGHATNTTTIGHLVGPGDLIIHDSLAHDSIIQGSLLSGAQRRPFPHNDWRELDRILSRIRHRYRRVLIPIEGAYSMDGDIPDLPKFVEVKKKHQALLFVDEAHSIGVLGATGRGVTEHFGVDPREIDALMGTLSKAFASCGGYIAGSRSLVNFLKYTAPGFVYSVGLPPSNAAAALESLNVLKDEPERLAQLRDRSALLLELLRKSGIDTGPSADTPIVPAIVGSSVKCLMLSDALAGRGINVQPILHPAVAEDATRLRFFVNSTHTEEQIRYTADALAEEWGKLAAVEGPSKRAANEVII